MRSVFLKRNVEDYAVYSMWKVSITFQFSLIVLEDLVLVPQRSAHQIDKFCNEIIK